MWLGKYPSPIGSRKLVVKQPNPFESICSSNLIISPEVKFKKSEWNHLGAFGYLRSICLLAGYPTLDKNSPHHSTSSTVSLLETWKIPPEKWLKVEGSETYGFLGGDTKFCEAPYHPQNYIHPWKRTWQWNIIHLKMYFLSKYGDFPLSD